MSVLLKSFLILSFRARALPVFPSILTPKSLPRNRRTRTLSSVSASNFQSPPLSFSPETPTPIPPLSDSLRWVSCTTYWGDLSNQDVGFRVLGRSPPVFLYGRDSEHWLIILEFPERPKPLKEEMIDTYVKTLASVVGSCCKLSLTHDLFGSDFGDIFDVSHFIDSLMDEVRIIKRLAKKFNRKYGFQAFQMSPVSWSNEKYYLEQTPQTFVALSIAAFFAALVKTLQIVLAALENAAKDLKKRR
ncbi:hypothetical protein PVK06_005871 [Gossypium arboreum]|uniref:O-fucosyltransferase family protein n=1 Tax=Gossypium arboreum TaxID=29729 RepID=A0ABR0QVQ6_GOSAR|nr:hypothetical protein PVK06_005871 [Gossypium arboreum]